MVTSHVSKTTGDGSKTTGRVMARLRSKSVIFGMSVLYIKMHDQVECTLNSAADD